jgi:hypothetical protein
MAPISSKFSYNNSCISYIILYFTDTATNCFHLSRHQTVKMITVNCHQYVYYETVLLYVAYSSVNIYL